MTESLPKRNPGASIPWPLSDLDADQAIRLRRETTLPDEAELLLRRVRDGLRGLGQ